VKQTVQAVLTPEPPEPEQTTPEKWPRIAVSIPVERGGVPNADIFWNFLHLAQQGWSFIPTPYGRTDSVRNTIAETVRKSDFTHVLMLDSDHMHPMTIVARFAAVVRKYPRGQAVTMRQAWKILRDGILALLTALIVVGGVIPPGDYDALYAAGASAIFPPGTVIAEAAVKLLGELNGRLGYGERQAAE